MYYTDIGNKSALPIIFIHAFPLSHEMWDEQRKTLESNYRVITYDLRGFGKTHVSDGQFSIELYVDDLFLLMDKLTITKAVIAGLSMGGYIALRAKERKPERFLGLILADTRHEADNDAGKIKRADTVKLIKEKGLESFVESFLTGALTDKTNKEKNEVWEKTRQVILKNSHLGVCGALLAMAARTDTSQALKSSPVPTLIIVGEEDKLTPLAQSELMHKMMPHSILKVIPRAGHLSNLENALEFNGSVLAFLQKLSLS